MDIADQYDFGSFVFNHRPCQKKKERTGAGAQGKICAFVWRDFDMSGGWNLFSLFLPFTLYDSLKAGGRHERCFIQQRESADPYAGRS